jgi:uncharacterized protein YjiS (DUF1127 family)
MTLLATSLMPHSSARRRRAIVLLARFRRAVNNWMAAMMAYRERQAALYALRAFSDHQLKDIGLHRGEIDRAIGEASRGPLRGRF